MFNYKIFLKDFIKSSKYKPIRYFLIGLLIPSIGSPLLYFNRTKINNFLGRKPNNLQLRFYDPKSIDQIDEFSWFKPQNHHKINSKEELKIKRKKLEEFIINKKIYSTNVIKNLNDEFYSSMKNLESIDKLIFVNSENINSNVYFFSPKKPNNKLIIFHQGHGGDFKISYKTLEFFNAKGYYILAYQMPLKGTNQPIENSKGIETRRHDSIIRFNKYEKSFISFFVTPVILGIDYLENRYNFDSISMMGISGGGWTTVMAAAVDMRIQFSFPIAGSLPLSLITNDIPDVEQSHVSIYQKFPYLDLYLLGSTGKNRKQLQISYSKDPCCFSGNRNLLYTEYLENLSSRLDGNFTSVVQNNNDHKIIPSTYKLIHITISSN